MEAVHKNLIQNKIPKRYTINESLTQKLYVFKFSLPYEMDYTILYTRLYFIFSVYQVKNATSRYTSILVARFSTSM